MNYWLAVCILLILLSGLTFLVWLYLRPETKSEKKDFVQLLSQVLGGAVLLVGLVFTWWNLQLTQESTSSSIRNAQETLRLSQEGQITERLTRAVDQLGSKESLPVRLGGIFALERIARDSARDHASIMELLTAYVRQYAKWDAKKPTISTDAAGDRPEIQAIMTVIGRRVRTFGNGENQPLNLQGTDLRSLHLESVHLESVILWWANLENAVLSQAHLENSRLTLANLTNSNLTDAHLEGAVLSYTNMENADLSGSFLQGATVSEVNFSGARLEGTHLEGADLSTCRGLTLDQIKLAATNGKTRLPANLRKPGS